MIHNYVCTYKSSNSQSALIIPYLKPVFLFCSPLLESFNVCAFSILCFSSIFEDGRCTCEIKSRIPLAKAAFNKKTLFTSKLDFNLRKKLVKCYIWCMALYGAETWRFGQQIRNTWKVFKCDAGEGWRRSVEPIM